ncbi:hypothetical protein HYFRA_00008220 [Hymenoscyphus fraxineus]|uniref:Uncharacterized protein n=1 Tax=Hymenoscyphus fraxineus TaxID=746836 RepID=A0A9N9PYL6_9HELO|nr:hypothetical protein HYFRA_00008220 [Hymenoscyphus fraxineus]
MANSNISGCLQSQSIEAVISHIEDYVEAKNCVLRKILSLAPISISLQITCNLKAIQPWGVDISEKGSTQVQGPCVITIEGLPSPSCVAYVGSKYGLRPEYWLGVFLLDQGLDVPETQYTPLSNYTRNMRSPHFLPILSYNGSPSGYDMQSTPRESSPSTPNAFHPKDHIRVVDDEGLALMRESPFPVLSNVLTRATSAWAQILNFVDADIDKCKILAPSPTADALGLALEQLRFNFDLLAYARQCSKDNLCLIESRGCLTWPGQDRFESGTAGRLVASLLADYQYLTERCAELSRRCESVSQILADTIKVIEARFIATFFGMNVDLFQNDPPVWIFFAVAVPVTGLTFLLLQGKNAMKDFSSKVSIRPFGISEI